MPVNMKNIIAEAFLKMVRQKGIDKITVKALIDECNISRQTFYYHFRDIMEVIEWSTQQAFHSMLVRSLEADTPKETVELLISSTMENRKLIRKLLDSQKRQEIEKLFVHTIRTYFQELIRNRREEILLNYSDMEVALDFWSFGLCGILLKCCGSEPVDAENLAEKICRLIPDKEEKKKKKAVSQQEQKQDETV